MPSSIQLHKIEKERGRGEKEERKKTRYSCINCCLQSLRVYPSFNEWKVNICKLTNVFPFMVQGPQVDICNMLPQGSSWPLFLSSCSWENKTTETDSIQFQVYSLDHVTAHEILFIQSQDVARVIYTLRVFALKSIAEKPWIKAFPLLSTIIYLTYSPWNCGQGRFILWTPYYISSPL